MGGAYLQIDVRVQQLRGLGDQKPFGHHAASSNGGLGLCAAFCQTTRHQQGIYADLGHLAQISEQLFELVLQNLAIGVTWQGFVPELHLDWHLEGREVFGDMGSQFRLRCACTLF